MRKTVLATALAAAAALPGLASAQDKSPHSVTGNMGIVSDYRFRGISQTFVQPAIQGGIDYSHTSGVYLGNWNSNVSGLSYPGGAGIEMDFYGGWKGGIGKDLTLDVGLLQYYYPKAVVGTTTEKFDTLELYGAISWKWLTAKYSHTLTDYFGVNAATTGGTEDSKGSGYLELNASYEIQPKLTLVGHIGKQTVKNYKPLDYTDWKVGVTYDMNGWLLGAAYVDTDADETIYVLNGKETGKSTLVLSVSKSF